MRRDPYKIRARRGKSTTREGEIARIVARQHGVVARRQLIRLGLSEDAIERRVTAERLFVVQPFAYSLIPEVPVRGRMMAAVITCAPGAALSHRAAAAVWDLGPWPTGLIDVTAPVRRRPRRGLRIHEAAVRRVVRDGFPITTVARTLVDQASHLPLGRLRDQFEAAERLGLLDVVGVEEQMRGRRGAKKIRLILAELTAPEPTRSELERAFRRLCRDAALPSPAFNVSLLGYDVDVHWPNTNVVVELDSWEFHRTRHAFEDDRRKAAVLAAGGYLVLRFTWRQVLDEPELVAAAISRRLQPAGW
jgi:very-short-patch-repair endonuclease